MANLNIELLRLTINDAFGHEHRIQPIARRAATMFAERIEQRRTSGARMPRSATFDVVNAAALHIDLRSTSDEQAASYIAGVWLDALALHLEG